MGRWVAWVFVVRGRSCGTRERDDTCTFIHRHWLTASQLPAPLCTVWEARSAVQSALSILLADAGGNLVAFE